MYCLPYEVGVSPSLHIRGMIAVSDIKKNAVIERCPVVIVPKRDVPSIRSTVLNNYYFYWNRDRDSIVLGYGSLINHSYTPNAAYKWDYIHSCMIYYAIMPIKSGEEVMINYNGVPDDMTPLDAGLTNFNNNA